jgi:hypothetical protein
LDFVTIAGVLNLSGKSDQDQNHAVDAVKYWLNSHSNWLLVFDNADNLTIVMDFLPIEGKGHILLTTRSQSVGKMAKRVEVEKMQPDEGALFLLRSAKIIEADGFFESASQLDQAKAREISVAMDGLPLALDQAGAYIEETSSGLSAYLDLYYLQRAELLKLRGQLIADHPDSVVTTWSLSFKKIAQANPSAIELLRFFAFLQADAIPEEMVTEGAPRLGPVLLPVPTICATR